MPSGLTFACAVAALWIAGVTLADYRRQRRLRTKRQGLSEEDFIRYFRGADVDDAVSHTVYRRLQREMLARAVPVQPADDLYGVHRIDNEELNELVEDLAKPLGRELRRPEHLDSDDPISTVEDLVRYLNSLPLPVGIPATDG